MHARVQVSNVSEVKLHPNGKDFPHLVAIQNVQTKFKMHLSNVNNAQANALRRTIACELPVYAYVFDYESLKTDDRHIIPEMIQKRMRMIPVNQRAQSGVYSLHAHNNTLVTMDVKTVLLDKNGKPNPWINHGYTLLTLQPGKSITIKDIHLEQSWGYIEDHGMHTLAWQCTSVATDVEPLNMFEGTGKSAHESNPREYDIEFGTNGTMPGRAIVQLACAELVKRLDAVSALMSKIKSDDNQYTLDIPNESDTIGNLIVAAACELFPQLQSCVYNVPTTERMCTLRIAYNEDINILFNTIIEREQALFNAIAAAIA